MTSAFSYLLKSGGLEREKDYPYTGKDGTCKFDKSKIAASVQNFTVVSVDEEQIAANLLKHGPLASKYYCLPQSSQGRSLYVNTWNSQYDQ